MNIFKRIGRKISESFKKIKDLFKPVTDEEAEGENWDELLPPTKPTPNEPIPEPEPIPEEPTPQPFPEPIDWKDKVDAALARFFNVQSILIGSETELMSGNKMKRSDASELSSKISYIKGLYKLFRKGMSMAQGGDIINTCESLPLTPSATSQTFNNVFNRLVVIMTGDTAPDELQSEGDSWNDSDE